MKPEEAETSYVLQQELRNAERKLARFQLRKLELVPGLEDLTIQERADRLWTSVETLTDSSDTSKEHGPRLFAPKKRLKLESTGQEYKLWFVLFTSDNEDRKILSSWARKESDGRFIPAESEELHIDNINSRNEERTLTNLEWSFVAYQEAEQI